MSTESCALCDKPTSSRHTPIRCKLCKKRFHVKCAKINSNQFRDLTDRGVDWHCDQCFNDIFPLASLDTYETFDFFNNSNPSTHPPPPPPPRNTRCSICPGKKKIKRTLSPSAEHALNTPTLDVLTLKVKTSLFLLNGYSPYVPLNHYRSPQSLMMTFCLLLMGVMQKPLISSKMYPPSASNPSLASFLMRILILTISSVTLLNQNIIRLLSL